MKNCIKITLRVEPIFSINPLCFALNWQICSNLRRNHRFPVALLHTFNHRTINHVRPKLGLGLGSWRQKLPWLSRIFPVLAKQIHLVLKLILTTFSCPSFCAASQAMSCFAIFLAAVNKICFWFVCFSLLLATVKSSRRYLVTDCVRKRRAWRMRVSFHNEENYYAFSCRVSDELTVSMFRKSARGLAFLLCS